MSPKVIVMPLLISLVATSPLTAQTESATSKQKDERPAQAFDLDLAVPESPAFVALGITPDKVSRPKTPRQFAADLQTGIDDSGNLQNGVAIDAVPYLIAVGNTLTLGQYRHNDISFGHQSSVPSNVDPGIGVRRLLSRISLSVATTKATDSDDKSLRLGLGFKMTPWDEGDTRLDPALTQCIGKFHKEVLQQMGNLSLEMEDKLRERLGLTDEDVEIMQYISDNYLNGSDEEIAALRARLGEDLFMELQQQQNREEARRITEGIEACFAEAKVRNWNASAWDIGIAPTWITEDGNINKLKSNGGTFWTSVALRVPRAASDAPEGAMLSLMNDYTQLIGIARYRWDTFIEDVGADTFHEQDDLLIGGRLRIGQFTKAKLSLSVEGAYIHEDPKQGQSTNGGRYAGSASFRVADGIWLQITAGTNDGVADGNQGFVFGSFRYGLTTEAPEQAF